MDAHIYIESSNAWAARKWDKPCLQHLSEEQLIITARKEGERETRVPCLPEHTSNTPTRTHFSFHYNFSLLWISCMHIIIYIVYNIHDIYQYNIIISHLTPFPSPAHISPNMSLNQLHIISTYRFTAFPQISILGTKLSCSGGPCGTAIQVIADSGHNFQLPNLFTFTLKVSTEFYNLCLFILSWHFSVYSVLR